LVYDAPKDAKLLAYTSLCRPILDYADVVWDPEDAKLLAYTSLCRPILDYADVVWDPAVRSKVQRSKTVPYGS